MRRLWLNLKLKNKFLAVIIPSILVTSAVIMIFSATIFRSYEEKLFDMSLQNMTMLALQMENRLENVENISDDIVINKEVQVALQLDQPNIRTKVISTEYNSMAADFYSVLNEKKLRDRDVTAITVLVENEVYSVSKNSLKVKYDDEFMDRIREAVKGTNGEIVWYSDGSPCDHIYCVRVIKEVYRTSFNNLGILLIEYDYASAVNSIMKENVGTSIAGKVAIFEGDKLLYSNLSGCEELDFNEANGTASLKNFRIMSVGGVKYLASYLRDEEYHWNYCILTEVDRILGMIRNQTIILLALAIVLILFVTWYCTKTVGSITKCIHYLLGRMRKVRSGDFTQDRSNAYKDRGDELGEMWVK